MEKGPRYSIIGNVLESETENFRAHQKKVFDNQNFLYESSEFRKKIAEIEKPKTEAEKNLIRFANQEVDKLMQEAGCEPFIIPEQNYHIIPAERVTELGKPEGYSWASRANHSVVINNFWERSPVHFGKIAFHETMHLKSYLGFYAKMENDRLHTMDYRSGVSGKKSDRKKMSPDDQEFIFSGLNEAIVSMAERGYVKDLLDQPELKKEKEWYESEEIKKIRHYVAVMNQIPEEEIFWLTKNGGRWNPATYPYREHRQVLEFLCKAICDKFPEEFNDQEMVFKEFLKASFTGDLLRVGRLIEKSCGKGSLDAVAGMSPEPDSASLTLLALNEMQKHNRQ